MATFPAGVVALTNPTANDTLAAVPHHTQHGNANDELEAIETFLLAGHINVLSHGAVGDDATDNVAAFQAAIDAAVSSGVRSIYVPAGTYLFSSGNLSLDATTGIDFFGDGMHASILHYTNTYVNETEVYGGFMEDAASGSLDTTLARGSRSFRDLQFRGAWTAKAATKVATLATSSASDNIIDTTAPHDFVAGDAIWFNGLAGGSGLAYPTYYYIISANLGSTTFQVSTTRGGAAVDFTTDITAGTATRMLPYAAMFFHSLRSLNVTRCRFEDISSQAISLRLGMSMQVSDCEFERIGADCVFSRSVYNQVVTGNTCKNTDDDVISLHQGTDEIAAAGMPSDSMVVADNICEDTCSIRCLGSRGVVIANNIMRRYKQAGISVSANATGEAQSQEWGITITGNQLYDGLTRPSVATGAIYGIVVLGTPRKDDSDADAVPGEAITATGVFERWFDFRDNVYTTSGQSTAPLYGLHITNNIIMRTLPPATNYSDWGFGSAFERTGWNDWNVSEADMRITNGVSIRGDSRLYRVSGNTVTNAATAIEIAAITSHYASDTALISDNLLFDFSRGIYVAGGAYTMRARISGNQLNGDPFHIHSNRTTQGRFLVNFNGPTGIDITAGYGYVATDNTFQNVCNPIRSTGTVHIRDSILYCDPATTGGFSTSNKGIGFVPTPGVGYVVMTTDSDPTSADYGKVTASTAVTVQGASLSIPAQSMWPSVTDGATAVASTEMTTNKQTLRYLAFPDAVTTYAETLVAMPSDWDGGTFTVDLFWNSAIAFFQVNWQVEARSYAVGEQMDDTWGTARTVISQAGGTTGFLKVGTTAAVTAGGTPAAGELLLLRIARLGGDVGDNLASDAWLLGARVNYTRSIAES